MRDSDVVFLDSGDDTQVTNDSCFTNIIIDIFVHMVLSSLVQSLLGRERVHMPRAQVALRFSVPAPPATASARSFAASYRVATHRLRCWSACASAT